MRRLRRQLRHERGQQVVLRGLAPARGVAQRHGRRDVVLDARGEHVGRDVVEVVHACRRSCASRTGARVVEEGARAGPASSSRAGRWSARRRRARCSGRRAGSRGRRASACSGRRRATARRAQRLFFTSSRFGQAGVLDHGVQAERRARAVGAADDLVPVHGAALVAAAAEADASPRRRLPAAASW